MKSSFDNFELTLKNTKGPLETPSKLFIKDTENMQTYIKNVVDRKKTERRRQI